MQFVAEKIQLLRVCLAATVTMLTATNAATDVPTAAAATKPAADTLSLECVTEHLGFAPIHFIDSLMSCVNTHLYKSMSKLESLVTEELGKGIETEKGMASIETLFENSVDKRFDRFEVFALSNIFNVPSELAAKLANRLDEHDLAVLDTDENQLDKENDVLRMKLLALKFSRTQMVEEDKCLDHVFSALEGVQQQIATLEQIARNAKVYPVDEHLKRLVSDLTEIQDLTDQVQTRVTHPIMRERIAESDKRSRIMQSEIATHIRKRRQLDSTNKSEEKVDDGEKSTSKLLAEAAAAASKLSAWDVTREYRDAMAIGSVKDADAFMDSVLRPAQTSLSSVST